MTIVPTDYTLKPIGFIRSSMVITWFHRSGRDVLSVHPRGIKPVLIASEDA